METSIPAGVCIVELEPNTKGAKRGRLGCALPCNPIRNNNLKKEGLTYI